MNKVRDIIRYKSTTELSERQIARALNVSRTVVAKTLRAFRNSGPGHAEAAGMPDSHLLARLENEPAPPPGGRYGVLAARFPQMVLELKKAKGMTLQYLWEQYVNEHPGGSIGKCVSLPPLKPCLFAAAISWALGGPTHEIETAPHGCCGCCSCGLRGWLPDW